MVNVDGDEKIQGPWYLKNIGVLLIIIAQTVAITAWLVQMHSDINTLQIGHTEIDNRLNSIDVNGSKAAALLQQRVQQVDERNTMVDKSIERLVERVQENSKQMNELSLFTARERPKEQGQLEQLQARIKAIEDTINARTAVIDRIMSSQSNLTPLQQTIIDGIKADIVRIEERQNRIVQALDQTYNLINEHMRASGEPKNPSIPTPSRKR